MTNWESIAVRVAARVEDCCGCNYSSYLSDEEEPLLRAKVDEYLKELDNADSIESAT